MTQEEKQLLLQVFCAMLPYGVKAKVLGWDEEKGEVEVPLRVYSVNTDGYVYFIPNDFDVNYLSVEDCPLYLRPMSSMTENEEKEYYQKFGKGNETYAPHDLIDWLNAHYFDYRGLIKKGLALEAPEGMYNDENTSKENLIYLT